MALIKEMPSAANRPDNKVVGIDQKITIDDSTLKVANDNDASEGNKACSKTTVKIKPMPVPATQLIKCQRRSCFLSECLPIKIIAMMANA